jgi:CAAX protease family protein
VLVVLRLAAGRAAMARVWLAWGNWRYWLLFGPPVIAFYAVQAALNAGFGMGPASPAPIPAPPGISPALFLTLAGVQSVLLVGVIWGAWHWPLILMGFSYPGYPLLGLLLTALFTSGLAVFLGYAVLRSGSVLLAAYLHALNDQVTAFIVAVGFKPFNNAFSFGVGIYGIATLAIVALLVLRDPVWRGEGSSLK